MVEIDYKKSFMSHVQSRRFNECGKESVEGIAALNELLNKFKENVGVSDENKFNSTMLMLEHCNSFAESFKSRYEQRTRFIGEHTQKSIDPIFDDSLRSTMKDHAYRVAGQFIRDEWVGKTDEQKKVIREYITEAEEISHTLLREQNDSIRGGKD